MHLLKNFLNPFHNLFNLFIGQSKFSEDARLINQNRSFLQKEHFQIEQFSFRNLTPKHKTKALQILGQEFYRQEPLTSLYSKNYPHNPSSIQQWTHFFSFFMDDAVINNLSVVALDRQNNDKIVGVCIARDICFLPPSFLDIFFGINEYPQTILLELEVQLKKQLHPELEKFLNQKGRTVDFWAGAIHQEYVGKKVLFKSMFSLMEKLAKEAGYTHGYAYSINGKTSLLLKKFNLQMIAKMDARKFVLRNKQPFTEVEQFHRYPSLWFKKL